MSLTLKQREAVQREIAREYRRWRRKLRREPRAAERKQIVAIGFSKARKHVRGIPKASANPMSPRLVEAVKEFRRIRRTAPSTDLRGQAMTVAKIAGLSASETDRLLEIAGAMAEYGIANPLVELPATWYAGPAAALPFVNAPKKHGLHVVYLPANMAWAVMWHDQILQIFNSKQEAMAEYQRLLDGVQENPSLIPAVVGGATAAIVSNALRNPYVVMDSGTGRIVSIERGQKGAYRRAYGTAHVAAQTAGRDMHVVSTPYVPDGWRVGTPVDYRFAQHHPTVTVPAEGAWMGAVGANPLIQSIGPDGEIRRTGILGPVSVTNAIDNRAPVTVQVHDGERWRDPLYASRVAISDDGLPQPNPLLMTVLGANPADRKPKCNPRACANPAHKRKVRVWKGFKGEWYWQVRDPHGKAPMGGRARTERGAKTIANRCLRKCSRKTSKKAVSAKKNPVVAANPGRRRKVTMPLAKFAAWVRAKRDPKLWRDFQKKVEGYKKWTHGTMPKTVTVEMVDKPGVNGVWMTYQAGRQPESTYIMPGNSKRKGAWKHPWETMPSIQHDPETGMILTKLRGRSRISDFYHK